MSDSSNKVEIEIFRKKDIPSMINDPRLWNQEYIATTKHRLNMHFNNEAMNDEDILLLVAWYDGNMIGYIGGFVDCLLTNDGYEKITWLHTWWMDPKYRFTKAGLMLFNRMYEVCIGKIGVSQFTPSAGRIYYKSEKFQTLTRMEGSKFLVKLSFLDYFRVKYRKLSIPLFPFLWLTDTAINGFALLLQKISLSKITLPKLEPISNLDDETINFIKKNNSEQICKREKDFFDSLIKNRVILQTYGPSINDGRYFFSHRANQFDFFYLKTKDINGEMDSFLVLQVRDGVLKVLYAFYTDNSQKKCAAIISNYVNDLKCHTLLIYDQSIIGHLRKMRTLYILERIKEKEIIVSKEFKKTDQWHTSTFHYGDGDCCFA